MGGNRGNSSPCRHGSGTRPRENRIESAPTLTDKNRVDWVRGRVWVFPDNPKRGRGRLSVLTPHIAKPKSYFAPLQLLQLSTSQSRRSGEREAAQERTQRRKVMEDISFSPEGIYPISSPINESPSPSPSPMDQTLHAIPSSLLVWSSYTFVSMEIPENRRWMYQRLDDNKRWTNEFREGVFVRTCFKCKENKQGVPPRNANVKFSSLWMM
ncbi:hypothetical protein JHK82_027867 [Glycine max]|nr:hypothetical protein JHK82_027867 [Glycine max]